MKLIIKDLTSKSGGQLSTLCPHCNKVGIFEQLQSDLLIGDGYHVGQRRCPNMECNGHLFVVMKDGILEVAYPPCRIEFDPTNVPKGVLKTFEEALDCHASGFHVASTIMVRRTLEEICADQSAKGDNLKKRIKDLRSKIVLPGQLFEAMDELRLLGNDAAHINARDYSDISKKELDIAVELTREILKALYQYSDLLARLTNLKTKDNSTEKSHNNSEAKNP